MLKVFFMLVAVLMISVSNGFAQEAGSSEAVVVNQESAPAAIEVGNTICPLSARELNLNDANDYTKLEVQGYVFNVCPKAKAEYDNNPSQYESKISEAITAVTTGSTESNN